MADINKVTGKDILYATTKAALGTIPLAGAAASEMLGLLIASPLEKRREKWMTEVGEKLKELEEKKLISLEGLSSNEQFVDTVLQVTTLAIKTSEEEKILAFKNAIINTALNESPNKILSQVFLNYIDTFTVWHIRLLDLFRDPRLWFIARNKKQPVFTMVSSLSSVVEHAYPEMKGQGNLLEIIWADLRRAGFHNSGDFQTMMSPDGALEPRATELGKEFIYFISDSST